MKKRIFAIIFVLSLIFLITALYGKFNLFAKPSYVYAVGDLTVDWGGGVLEGQPIFSVNNMFPGQTESHTVTITNDASSARPVGIRAVQNSDTGNIASKINIIISSGGVDLYGGTLGSKSLADFFADSTLPSFVSLTTLSSGESKSFEINANFDEDANNLFQGKTVNFDIKIGVAVNVPLECSNINFAGDPIFGTENNDTLFGTNGNDLIIGLEGNDNLFGSNGMDCIIGGLGADKINGGNGKDYLFGSDGNDDINGSNNEDQIFGESGNDKINGSNGDDRIFGGSGKDKIDGSNGDDYIEGNEGNDEIKGSNGDDMLLGGLDVDKTNGELGTDSCNGENRISCEVIIP